MITSKKYIIIGGAAAMLLSGAIMVSAESVTLEGDISTTNNTAVISSPAPMPMPSKGMQPTVLEVSVAGRVLLRGTIDTVGTNSLTVKSWGGDWTINIASSTQLMPGSGITQFAVGDFVGVQGSINTAAAWTIDATLVRDWTVRATAQTNKEEIRAMVKASSPRNWEGIASNVSADAKTFTLTVNGTAYTINLTADAKVVNKAFISLNFSSIQNGDTVRVYGPATDTTITASVVRDVSTGMATGR